MASDEVRMSILEDRVMQLGDEVRRLEAQLGVTDSTDSQKDHLRAGIRYALGTFGMHSPLADHFRELLHNEPKGTS